MSETRFRERWLPSAELAISVAAELAGLHPQTLRIYEREDCSTPAAAGGTRRYSRRDIDRLQEISALTADGLNLAGIRRVLQLQEETRQLQAELTRLRALAGDRAAPPPRTGIPQAARRQRDEDRVLPRLALVLLALAGEPFAQAAGQGARQPVHSNHIFAPSSERGDVNCVIRGAGRGPQDPQDRDVSLKIDDSHTETGRLLLQHTLQMAQREFIYLAAYAYPFTLTGGHHRGMDVTH